MEVEFQRVFLKRIEKRSLMLLSLAAALLVSAAVVSSSGGLQSGDSRDLVAEYRIDERAGNKVYDAAGDNDGSINGATWTEGRNGKALSFDGQDDYLEAPDSSSLDVGNGELTVSAWVYFEEDSNGNNWMLFDKGTNQAGTYYMYSDGNNLRMTVKDGSSRYDATADPSLVPENKWVHLAGTYNGSLTELWLNGERIASTPSPSNLGSNDQPLWIGDYQGGNYELEGKVDEALVHSIALNKSQINSLYNSGSWRIGSSDRISDPSKLLDISFSKKNSTHVFDTSGYENHGELLNDPVQETSGGCKVGRCYSFDGLSDHIAIPEQSQEDFTVMMWTEYGGLDENGDESDMVLSNRGAKGDFLQTSTSTSNGFGLRIAIGGDSQRITWDGLEAVGVEDELTHIAIRKKGTEIEAFYNGESQGTKTLNSDYSFTFDSLGAGWNGNSRYSFKGTIDQFKFYNRSLSQTEITERTEGLSSEGAVLDMRFNLDGGDLVEDYSGSDNYGRINPNLTAGADRVRGVVDGALRFDGDNDMVELPADSSAFDFESPASYSWWMKTDEGSGGFYGIIGSHESSNPYAGWAIANNNGEIRLWTDQSSWQNTGVEIADGKWHHYTARINGSTFELYKDGEQVSTLSYDPPSSESVGFYVADRNEQEGNPFKGSLDELKIYPYRVSENRIEELYTRGKTQIGGIEKSSQNLQDGLVLSQTFDRIETCGQSDTLSCPSGMSGEVGVDETRNANHGELVNDPSVKFSGNCKFGSCLGFKGDSDKVSIPHGSDVNITGDLTFSAWLKSSDLDQNGRILHKHQAYTIYLYDGTGNLRFYNYRTGTNDGGTSTNLPENEWVHLAGKYDSESGIVEWYVDGENIGQNDIGSGLGYSKNDLEIGLDDDGNSYDYSGLMDQIRLYDRSLSKDEIWRLYTRGRDKSSALGPVALWRLDKGEGQIAYDSAENYQGLLGGSTSSESSDPEWVNTSYGKSLNFDGNDDHIEVQDIGDKLNEANAFTISYRIKYQNFENFQVAYGNSPFWTEPYRDGSRGVSIRIQDDSGNNYRLQSGHVLESENNWYRITYTWDGQYLKAYVDGEEVGSLDTGGADLGLSTTHYIGSYDGTRNVVNATMDDVRVYPYALDQEQIKQVDSGAVSLG